MKESYQEYKDIIDDFLLDYIPQIDNKSNVLYESIAYSLKAGGKRLRPVLLLAACEFAGGTIKDALPYACALEYIHTYSLIHDDLPAMDDDDYRRGLLTNHKVFGDAIAILAGDGLLTTAFEVMNKDMYLYFDNLEQLKKRINASYIIAKNAGVQGMVAGQASDMEVEAKDCSSEMIEYIHLNKTGALIVAAVKAGLYIASSDNEKMQDMTAYAENLGLAYQIADDILDVKGNAEELGKATGADANRHKITYVSKNGLEESEAKLKYFTDNAVAAIEKYYDNAEFFRDLVLDLSKRNK
ncbi:geranylgeranyl diphosphate synthase, type II [Peptostreptococcaceae bacterium pGA-8]|nr:geranylgeranyl diphosphate synthase, type II [Peptostreptococcaceae bacterium pGA-8]